MMLKAFEREQPQEIYKPPKRKREHKRMVDHLAYHPEILREALGLDFVWIRTTEYSLSNVTNERADLVFQDKYNAYCPEPGTTCFVVELKSETADHEVVGQLQKAVDLLTEQGQCIRHWDKVRGIAVAKRFTPSGLDLLRKAWFQTFVWCEAGGKIWLEEVGEPAKRAMKMSDAKK
jgi:RecB family endonuclease NucS